MNGAFKTYITWFSLASVLWILGIGLFLYSPYIHDWFMGHQKSLKIFVWSDIVEPKLIQTFEEQNNIKVYVNYYEGNDELLAKLQFSGGKGYDIIMPTHYLLPSLIERKFLKPIDPQKISAWQLLDPQLMQQENEQQQIYAVPFVWELYGLGINQKFFSRKQQKIPTSWQALFEPCGYRVGMTDEPREIIHLAATYLFGQLTMVNDQQNRAIKRLLIKQKKFVEAYTDLNTAGLLTSGACPVILTPSGAMYRALKIMPQAQFVLPNEGSVIALENMVISAYSNNEDLAYKFINFMLEQQNMHAIYQQHGFLPARTDVLQTLDLSYMRSGQESVNSYIQKTPLITLLMPRHELNALWLAIKAY